MKFSELAIHSSRASYKHAPMVPHLNGPIRASAGDEDAVPAVGAAAGRGPQPTLRTALHDAFVLFHVIHIPYPQGSKREKKETVYD